MSEKLPASKEFNQQSDRLDDILNGFDSDIASSDTTVNEKIKAMGDPNFDPTMPDHEAFKNDWDEFVGVREKIAAISGPKTAENEPFIEPNREQLERDLARFAALGETINPTSTQVEPPTTTTFDEELTAFEAFGKTFASPKQAPEVTEVSPVAPEASTPSLPDTSPQEESTELDTATRTTSRPESLATVTALHEVETPIKPNYEAFARQVEPDELVREPGNNGKPLDPNYLKNHQNVRQLFVDKLVDDSMYESLEHFIETLQEGHRLAAAGNIYGKVGESKRGLHPSQIGVFRKKELVNGRLESAKKVAEIAKQYGDPYAQRFEKAMDQAEHAVDKTGLINLPVEDKARDLVVGAQFYQFSYPNANSIPAHMEQIQRVGREIQAELQADNPDVKKAIDLIARQYSYGAIIRPFAQINNSLFMNLANAQLKLFGVNGIPHGMLDHAAQRLQSDTFARYFADQIPKITSRQETA